MKYRKVHLSPEHLEIPDRDIFSVSRYSDGNRRRREIMRRVIAGELTEKQRQCVFLYYGEGRTTAEIAEKMGTTKGSVSKLLKRARDRIRKHLEYAGEKGDLHFFS